MRKLLCLILTLCAVLTFAACTRGSAIEVSEVSETDSSEADSVIETSREESTVKNNITPLLWKVTNNDSGAVVWLFGSSLADEKAFPLPDAVMSAYESSENLIVLHNFAEENIDVEKVLKEFEYPDGSSIKKHIPEDIYQKANRIVYNAYGTSGSVALDGFKPIMWVTEIEKVYTLDSTFTDSIDSYFITQAQKDKKHYFALEDYNSLIKQFTNLSDALQVFLLKRIININAAEYIKQLSNLYDAWSVGAAGFIEQYFFDTNGYTQEEQRLLSEYNKIFYEDKIIRIAEALQEYLSIKTSVFACISIEHFVGEKGVVKLLTDAGYQVERVYT